MYICSRKTKKLFYYPNDPVVCPVVHIAKGEVLKTFPVRWPAWTVVTAVWEENLLPVTWRVKAVSHPLSSWRSGLHKQRWVGWPWCLSIPRSFCRGWCFLMSNVAHQPQWGQCTRDLEIKHWPCSPEHHWPMPAGSHENWTEVWTREAFTKTQSLFSGRYLA